MTSDTSKQHHDTAVDTANAPGGFSSLPLEVISTHILRSDFLPELGDLGRLRAVSRRMRDAVDATGREIMVVPDWHAARLGYLSLLKDRHTRGVLGSKEFLCGVAARGGHLEVLKWARANGCPWDGRTCAFAAEGGHLEVLKWARANGCPWDENSRQLATDQWPEVFA